MRRGLAAEQSRHQLEARAAAVIEVAGAAGGAQLVAGEPRQRALELEVGALEAGQLFVLGALAAELDVEVAPQGPGCESVEV